MANKKISELQSRTPALSDLMLVGDPSSGYSYKCTVTALATIIETDIADGYVTIGTTQTISGAKTFSNNLTLTSVVNTPTDPDKFLTLNGSNVVTYRTGAEVLSDIGGVGGSGTTNYLPKFSATTTLANSQIFDNGTNIGIATATPDATARVQINKTDGYGLYLNYNTSAGSGVTTTALYAINTTASSGYAAVIEEKTPNTTAGQYPFVIKHSLSSGTAGVGFGTGVHFQLLDDVGTSKTTQLTIENIDAAAATYKTRYRFNVQNNGSSTPVVYINATGLGVFTASPSVALDVTGEGKFSTINNATTDTDKFLVSDSGVLKYRTGTEILSDIGGQATITLTTTGSSGSATFVSNTLNIPTYTLAGLGGISLTSLSASSPLSYNSGTGAFSISQSSGSTNGYLSSTDWTTFNNKQNAITLTTTGTSGAATLVGSTLNIPQYQAALTNPVTGTGTTNYVAKFTSSSTIGNSLIYDDGNTMTFSTNATERMRLTSGGSLGLGTSSPAYKLDIYGGASGTRTDVFVANAAANYNIGVLSDNNGFASTTNAMLFYTGASERMRISPTGSVGIGTSSSITGQFHVYTAGYKEMYVTYPSTYATRLTIGNSPTYIETEGGGETFTSTNTYSNGSFVWKTGASGSERMRLDASGNLGLGVTPNTWGGINGKIFELGYSGGSAALFQNGADDFWTASNAYYNSGWKYVKNGTATAKLMSAGQHQWFTAPSGTAGNAISFTQAMTLDASGRLGIGTTSPGDKLQVDGNVYANAFHAVGSIARFVSGGGTFIAGLNGSSYGYIQSYSDASGTGRALAINPSGGNVGIGTTSPTGLLHLYGADPAFRIQSSTTGNMQFGQWDGTYNRIQSSGRDFNLISTDATNLLFSTNSTERMRITSGGNVLIGTTSTYYANNLIVAAGSEGGITIANSNTTGAQYLMFADGTSGADRYRGYLAYDHTANNLFLGTDGVERMRITSGGNVLIGNLTDNGFRLGVITASAASTPRNAFEVSDYTTTDIKFRLNNGVGLIASGNGQALAFGYNSTTEAMRITSGGELLINTTSDAGDYKLQVNGSSWIGSSGTASLVLQRGANTNGATIDFNTSTTNKWYIGLRGLTNENFYIYNQTAGVNNLILDASTGAAEFSSSIKTAAPSGGTAAAWKLGERVASSGLTLNDTQYIQLDIAGTLYTLATVNLP